MMTRARILLVEDEPDIQLFVRRYLEQGGYEVTTARDGETALLLERRGTDLVVLDLMLPGIDGLEVVRRLRAADNPVPILILSAREEEGDRVSGLELGADDYLTKPFRPRELLARVRALLRRARMPALGSRQAGPVTIDAELGRASVDGILLDLSRLEYDLLRALVGAPGKNFSREELLDRVWGREYLGETRRVDLMVSKLRSSLRAMGREDLIRSVWGVGYRYEP